jgi:hypothetical protein
MSALPGPALTSRWVMRLDVTCAPPLRVGPTDDGLRENYPIIGGRFAGPALRGEVLSGVDRFLRRSDGVGILDARYALRTEDGVVINLHNRGVLWSPPGSDGQPDENGPYRCHCVPVFEPPLGRYAWLNQVIFAGRVAYPAPGHVCIDVFRFDPSDWDQQGPHD